MKDIRFIENGFHFQFHTIYLSAKVVVNLSYIFLIYEKLQRSSTLCGFTMQKPAPIVEAQDHLALDHRADFCISRIMKLNFSTKTKNRCILYPAVFTLTNFSLF